LHIEHGYVELTPLSEFERLGAAGGRLGDKARAGQSLQQEWTKIVVIVDDQNIWQVFFHRSF
jgi:hypothetical protein